MINSLLPPTLLRPQMNLRMYHVPSTVQWQMDLTVNTTLSQVVVTGTYVWNILLLYALANLYRKVLKEENPQQK